MHADERLLDLAARQHGCASIAQALSCGLSLDQIQHRVRRGRLARVGSNVLRIVGAPVTWEQQLLAGLLDLGPTAVVSRRAAAALLGLDGFAPGPVEFTVLRRHRSSGPWRVHSAVVLDKVDRASVGPIACTTASRTILDLARTEPAPALRRAIDSALREGLASPTFLRTRLARLRGPGRHGVRLLDDLLVDSGGHSALERAFLELMRRAGFPRPACQRIFRKDGTTIARVDFSFEPAPVVAEVNGRRGHSSDAERAKDGRRRNELQSVGYIVLEFSYDQVFREPAYVEETVGEAIGCSGHRPPHIVRSQVRQAG